MSPRVEYFPTAFWKEENYSKYPIWSRFVAREASQVGNARSLGHAESKRGPVNTKSNLVMDRRAKDSDGLLCVRVRAYVAPRPLPLHLHTLPPPPTALIPDSYVTCYSSSIVVIILLVLQGIF